MDKYFLTYDRSKYKFINTEVLSRFRNIAQKPVGDVVLGEFVELARSAGYEVPIQIRSRYSPEMLVEPCRKFERGGKMGRYDRKLLAQAFHRVKRKFRLRKRISPLPVEVVPFDPSKNAGLPYLTTKGDSYPYALERAKRIIKGEVVAPPTVIGHRGKNEKVARPVHIVPFEQILVEGMFFYPLQEQWTKGFFPYCAGIRPAVIGMKVGDMRSSTRLLGFDYSGFDGSISARLIHMAFDIIKSCFELKPDQEATFEYVVRYFITSPMVAPDGFVYKGRRHGVPSGSMFTQMIDSLVNSIIIEYSALRLNVEGLRYLVLGDDSLVGFESGTTDLHMWSEMMAELGITMSPQKSELFEEDEQVHFLGQRWEHGLPGKDVEEALSKLACPERVRADYFSKETRRKALLERVNAYVDNNGTEETNGLLRKIAFCIEFGGNIANLHGNYWRLNLEDLSLQKSEHVTGRAQYDEKFRRELEKKQTQMIRPAIVL